jgi:hypothetical protein
MKTTLNLNLNSANLRIFCHKSVDAKSKIIPYSLMHSTRRFRTLASLCAFSLLSLTSLDSSAQLLWQVGMDDNTHAFTAQNPGDGGGPNATFVQEDGQSDPLPGFFDTPEEDRQGDDDYYFEGVYTEIIPSNGDYVPLGVVAANDEVMERAFVPTDLVKRFHFNLPAALQPTDLLSVSFDVNNFDQDAALAPRPRFGVEVYFNNVLVQPEILITPAQLDQDFTTPQFTLESVGAVAGPSYDNIVTLKGVAYNSDGGGRWMGIDYVQLNQETTKIPAPVFPWAVGKNDNAWPAGDGGGTNATFVQEDAVTNPLPGSKSSTDTSADNDYYFAGNYTNVLAGNGTYEPVGVVAVNEEGAERAITTANTELRYHFNIPPTVQPSQLVRVRFDALSLDTAASNPRFGIQVLVNGVPVGTEQIIGTAQLGTDIVTPGFTLASVGAQIGSGHDNIVTLRGVSYNGQNGGNFIGLDYIQLEPVLPPIPPPVLPWSVGMNDNLHFVGNGGGINATFVRENDGTNALPGSNISQEVDNGADDDYYFAGIYTNVIASNGTYTPIGEVRANEEAAERALAGVDNFLRYHFNLPANVTPDTKLAVSFDFLSIEGPSATTTDPHYGVEVYVNGVKVQDEITVRPENVGTDGSLPTIYTTPAFTVSSVNAQAGPGFDNIVTLKGINHSAEGGGNWLGLDYVQLTPVPAPALFPWSIGKDDNAQHDAAQRNVLLGGAANANFVQEAGGITPLPGNPANPPINQTADNDYYLAGIYTTPIPAVVAELGDYTPVGTVLVHEEAAERAFAGTDNDMRYHFNLPTTLQPTDQLLISYDIVSLHIDPNDPNVSDPHYGIEVWFNGVKLQDEIVIRPENIDQDYIVGPFSLASVGAVTGPGADNIISLRGINYSGEGGGNWMGIDYVALNPMPKPVFPLTVGLDDNDWIFNARNPGNGGGANATFVQENGTVNELPGKANSLEVDQQSDNDYYFAGAYTTVVPANGAYEPIGIVPLNEESVERALTPSKTELRYHFNLPDSLKPTNQIAVTFDALNLEDPSATVTNASYSVEVYFNGVLVLPAVLITTNELDVDYTTPAFTLASVNAQVGLGTDNIVTLKGIDHSNEGGGNWMGIDFVSIHAAGDTGSQPQFTSTVLSGGNLTITWTGTGTLESTPVLGPGAQWDPVTPAPTGNTYTTSVTTGNRFFRIRR